MYLQRKAIGNVVKISSYNDDIIGKIISSFMQMSKKVVVIFFTVPKVLSERLDDFLRIRIAPTLPSIPFPSLDQYDSIDGYIPPTYLIYRTQVPSYGIVQYKIDSWNG